ncbi:MAG: alanine dehydrogenase [Alphaproteobacteria bacterium]
MIVGAPKEIKNHEYRVGLVPETVRELTAAGHTVLIESGAGDGIGITNDDYQAAGAEIADAVAEVFGRADLVVKVKEPQPVECERLRPDQTLFTYLHLAADPELTKQLAATGATAIAYETVTDRYGKLPLLLPMSQVAGRMSIQVGAHFLEKEAGGSGVLLGGVPGVEPGKVVILGGGSAGASAARISLGVGADVTIIQRSMARIQELDEMFGGRVRIVHSTQAAIERLVPMADLLVGAVLAAPGAQAPKLVDRELVGAMRPGSVIVDIAIDQGGCIETSRPTTHDEPIYVAEGVSHYCVTNMPGGVARTSTFALNNATRPFVLALANRGVRAALDDDPNLANGLNVDRGLVVLQGNADG